MDEVLCSGAFVFEFQFLESGTVRFFKVEFVLHITGGIQ
jgi:hypothetical protein